MRSLRVMFLFAAASGVLPPGLEDELFCPEEYCQRRKDHPSGFKGPRASFWTCILEGDPSSRGLRPIAWGSRRGEEAKTMLLQAGHHSRLCAGVASDQSEAEAAAQSESAADSEEAEEAAGSSGNEAPQQPVEESAAADKPPPRQPPRPPPADAGMPVWQILAAIAVIGATAMKVKNAQASKAAEAWAAQSQDGKEEARKRQIERFEREAKERAATAEWRSTQQEAEREAKGAVITPEHRKNTMSQSTTGKI